MTARGLRGAVRETIEGFRGARRFTVGGRGALRVTLLLAFRNGGPGRFSFERALEGRPFRGGTRWSAGENRFPSTGSGDDRLRGGRAHTIASEAVAPPVAMGAVVEGRAVALVSCPLGLKEAA